MTQSHWYTIILGVVLITVITPLTQFMTIMTINTDMETASPAGWAVGVVFSLILVLAVLRLFVKRRLLSPPNLVVLYAMLTLSVPLMNLGMMRPMFVNTSIVIFDYLENTNNTFRTAYSALKEEWHPVVPTREGLAWNKADRALRMLEDPDERRERLEARRRIVSAIEDEQQRLAAEASALDVEELPEPVDPSGLEDLIEHLGPDEIVVILSMEADEVLLEWSWRERLLERYEELSLRGEAAADSLIPVLVEVDEFYLSLLPGNVERLDVATRLRLDQTLEQMTEEQRREVERDLERIKPHVEQWRDWVRQLGEGDYERAREETALVFLSDYEEMSREEFDAIKNDFVFRLNREDRRQLIRQDGRDGVPNQNIHAFRNTLFSQTRDLQRMERQSFLTNLKEIVERLPWTIWVKPLFFWGLLITAIFLFLLCLAEWFRRKWVDQENLAFPLVEIADNMIRHDSDLENAEDPGDPPPRKGIFSAAFLMGCTVGFTILCVEALGHYGIIGARYTFSFNASTELFETGLLRQISRVIVVIFSPILVGIIFLLSLQVSLSIWVTFVLYILLVWLVPGTSDSLFTSWASGQYFPFPMEQMMGAFLCYGLFIFYKAWATPKEQTAVFLKNNSIPPLWTRAGLILLPIVIAALLWHFGVSHPLLLGLFGFLFLAQVITAARLRAETGLPTHHVSYDFTKMPVIFGMTGMTGAKTFTSYAHLMFLPWTLLFRTLPQQLENIELARRNRMRYSTVTFAGLAAFFTVLIVGMGSYLLLSHYFGGRFIGTSSHPGQFFWSVGFYGYGLVNAHFFGEVGLDQFTEFNWLRLATILIGFSIVAGLLLLRKKFLGFPIHPIGYLILLFSLYHYLVDPYFKGDGFHLQQSRIWFSAFCAWLIKSLIIKYGGMNYYKQAKPFFIGLVIGSIFCIFAWNVVDLGFSIWAEGRDDVPGIVNIFLDTFPYSPRYY